jgi:predicted nucleotidyltransferase
LRQQGLSLNEKFIDLTGKIESEIVEVFSAISTTAHLLAIPFFLIGAFARDFLFQHYGIARKRLTLDIDIGIQVSSWAKYDNLRNELIRVHRFLRTDKAYRLKFKEVEIDIIPFGNIGSEDSKISYPPDHKIRMSVAGFQEAFNSSITMRIRENPNVEIRIATLAGIALLKLIAWEEKYPERAKDALDLLGIMDGYEDAGQVDRLYEQEQDILKEEDFDNALASIRLLGIDMSNMANQDTFEKILAILENDGRKNNLARQMIERSRADAFESALLKLGKLLQGFRDKKAESFPA